MYKLIVFDMDGVLFPHSNFWMQLHKAYGTYEKGLVYTKKYLKTDYGKLVESVVNGLWLGKPADIYFKLINEQKYLQGVKETFAELKKRNCKTAIISSGPSHLAARAKKDFNIDFVYTNRVIIKNNKIARCNNWKRNWPIAHANKLPFLKKICEKENISLKNVAAVLNDDNDIPTAKVVGLSIAFNCDVEELKKVVDVVIDKKDLRGILKYIG